MVATEAKSMGSNPLLKCIMCGRPIKNPRSMKNGMGPVCYKKSLKESGLGPDTKDVPRELAEDLWAKCIHECPICNAPLLSLVCYPHEGGHIEIEGVKHWIVSECSKCKAQWSLHKLIRRKQDEHLIKGGF